MFESVEPLVAEYADLGSELSDTGPTAVTKPERHRRYRG